MSEYNSYSKVYFYIQAKGCFIYECTSICWLLAGIDVHSKSEAILNQNEYSWCLPLLWAVERVSRKGERSLGIPLICVRWNN